MSDTPRRTWMEQYEELDRVRMELLTAVIRALRIDRAVDWLNRTLFEKGGNDE